MAEFYNDFIMEEIQKIINIEYTQCHHDVSFSWHPSLAMLGQGQIFFFQGLCQQKVVWSPEGWEWGVWENPVQDPVVWGFLQLDVDPSHLEGMVQQLTGPCFLEFQVQYVWVGPENMHF